MAAKTYLKISRNTFKSTLEKRVSIGNEMLTQEINTSQEANDLNEKRISWKSYNEEYVKQSFDPPENVYYNKLTRSTPSPQTVKHALSSRNDISAKIEGTKNDIRDHLRQLKLLIDKIDLIPCIEENELTMPEKLHKVLEYIVEVSRSSTQSCFTPDDVKQGMDIEIDVEEVEYLCNQLVQDGLLMDSSSNDGFQVCINSQTKYAVYDKRYLKNMTEHKLVKNKGLIMDIQTHSDNIFIVHGHDGYIKESTARLIEKLGLEPIILHEQVNSGQTIIEKIENYKECGYAIIILTQDDEGRSKCEEILLPRARQNVILEMGYFMGVLGRDRISILYEEGVELPTDVSGVVYTLIDKGKLWQYEIGKELKAAGYEIDLHNI